MPKKTAAKKVAKKTTVKSKKPAAKKTAKRVSKTMSDEQINVMLSDVVKLLDYDQWKEIYGDENTRDELIAAARKHLRG